ncbi:MAG: RNA polymerase sigma factor [Verrucomicrobiota bacterium]
MLDLHCETKSAATKEPVIDPLAALVERVRAQDESAAQALVEQLYPHVAKIVHAHLPRHEDPEDLIQEIFLKMFSRLHQFNGRAPLTHWLSRIALNTCFDRMRQYRSRPELLWSDLNCEDRQLVLRLNESQPARDADAPQARALLDRLLTQLTPEEAWLIRRIELDECSLKEVCNETGWNSTLARVRLFRARRHLQSAWHRLEGTKP